MITVITMDDEVGDYETVDRNKNKNDITLTHVMNEERTMKL